MLKGAEYAIKCYKNSLKFWPQGLDVFPNSDRLDQNFSVGFCNRGARTLIHKGRLIMFAQFAITVRTTL